MSDDDPFAGKTVRAASAYYLDTSGEYTPALTATTTDPNLGADGVQKGAWHRNGHLITGWARFRWDGTGVSAGSGTYEISIPFEADSSIMDVAVSTGESFVTGIGYIFANTNGGNIVYTRLTSVSVLRVMRDGTTISVSDSNFDGVAGEEITVNFAYLADPAGLPT